MKTATPTQRLILDAAIDRSVIHGTLTVPSGDRRDFHGWLELNTALEAALDARADRAPSDNPAASAAIPANARDPRPSPPVTQSSTSLPDDPAPRPRGRRGKEVTHATLSSQHPK
jgi:hypothetical protein